jgi:hypothetical protein
MALTKKITVTSQYQNNSNSPTTVNFVSEAVVSGSQLVAGHKVTRPGVFTAGTPIEGNASNPQP